MEITKEFLNKRFPKSGAIKDPATWALNMNFNKFWLIQKYHWPPKIEEIEPEVLEAIKCLAEYQDPNELLLRFPVKGATVDWIDPETGARELLFSGDEYTWKVIDDYIDKTTGVYMTHFCTCRETGIGDLEDGHACSHNGKDYSCVFIGESTKGFPDDETGHHGTKEEAKARIHAAFNDGVRLTFGYGPPDASFYQVPAKQLFTICLCCDECCIDVFMHKTLVEDSTMPDVFRAYVAEPDKCIGCGLCAKKCPFKEITMVDGRPQIGEHCMGCGRCSAVCPKDAMHLKTAYKDYVGQIHKLLDCRVSVDETMPVFDPELMIDPTSRIQLE